MHQKFRQKFHYSSSNKILRNRPEIEHGRFHRWCHVIFFTFAKFWNFSKTAVLCRLVQTWYIWLDKSRTNKLDLVLVVMSCMLCHLTYVILLNQFDAIKHISDFEPIFARFRIFVGGTKQKGASDFGFRAVRCSGWSVFTTIRTVEQLVLPVRCSVDRVPKSDFSVQLKLLNKVSQTTIFKYFERKF